MSIDKIDVRSNFSIGFNLMPGFIVCFRGAANEGKRQLVILHPTKVSVYSLHLTEGLAEHGS